MFLFLGSLLWVCFLFFFVDDDSDQLLSKGQANRATT